MAKRAVKSAVKSATNQQEYTIGEIVESTPKRGGGGKMKHQDLYNKIESLKGSGWLPITCKSPEHARNIRSGIYTRYHKRKVEVKIRQTGSTLYVQLPTGLPLKTSIKKKTTKVK